MAVANTLEMVTGALSVSPQLFAPTRSGPARGRFGADPRVRDELSRGIWSRATGSRGWRGFPATSRSPANTATASRFPIPRGWSSRYRSPARRPTHRGPAIREVAGARHSLSICNVPESALVRASELRFPYACGARDRRRLDQGLHHPARGAGALDHDPRQDPRQASGRARDRAAAIAAAPAAVRSRASCTSSRR